MKVDIVVPVYNGAKHLVETLESVQNQTISFDNVIIVEDASEDNSLEIIEKFVNSNSNFTLIENSKNQGLGESLRIATFHSSSDFICILGQDDLIPIDYLQKALTFLNFDGSIIHSDYILIDTNGLIIPQTRIHPLRIPFTYRLIKGNYLYLQTLGNFISTVGIFLNTQSIRTITPFKTMLINTKDNNIVRTYDEYLAWILMAAVGGVVHMKDNHPFYRLHENNMTNKLVINEDILAKYRENGKAALKLLISQEPIFQVIFFLLYVYFPVWIFYRIYFFLKTI